MIIKSGRQKKEMNDKGDFPTAQVLGLGQVNNVRNFTPYGFFCSPPLESTWLLFSIRDNPDDIVGIGHDFINRFKNLKLGECALANTVTGTYIKLSANGDVEIEAKNDFKLNALGNVDITAIKDVNMTCDNANITVNDKAVIAVTTSISVNCPTTNWTGDINLAGKLTASDDVIASGISLNSHTHGGVTIGVGNTGGPQ